MVGRKDHIARDLQATLQDVLGSRYEDFSFVNRGGMGAIYRALHRHIRQPVAIKVMFPGESTERFLREARVLAKIRSPNVVTVHEFEMLPNGLSVLVMDWIEGKDLAATMKQHGGKVAESDALPWMLNVCSGMSTAAKEGVVHRDLKPSNILISQDRVALVADFGLARELLPTSSNVSSYVVGTPYYMSPEQAERPRSTDTRSDIYSFGATFYHALTGGPMFDGESVFAILFKHKTEPAIPPKTRNGSLSDRISDLIERCVAKWPGDRFQSFGEIAAVLSPTSTGDSLPWNAFVDEQISEELRDFNANRQKYLSASEPFDDSYHFLSNRKLRITLGDICDQRVDVIVSSDDENLSMSGGVSSAILKEAGKALEDEVASFRPARQGRAVVTSAGELPHRFIFHGVTMDYSGEDVLLPSRDVIAEIIDSCFYQAETFDVKTIAFPLLGSGAGGYPKEVCLDTMFRVLARMLRNRPTTIREVTIVIRRR